MLVKPGDRDTYAELLATLPELVPDHSPYDAMTGNPAPSTIVELDDTALAAIMLCEPARSFRPDLVKYLEKKVLPLRNEGEPKDE